MRRLLHAAGLALGLALGGTAWAADMVLPPDWVQLGTRGVDAAVSADNQRWMVGADGRAYRWNDATRSWAVHGDRADLARIDAAPNGAAAITRSGELVIADLGGQWRGTGLRAADVGIGGGRIWLAEARLPGGRIGALVAPFDPAARTLQWSEVAGRIERVDVDPQGRPWGLDREGRLFVHDGRSWIEDARAPAAIDVGAGPRGEIVLVARPVDAAQGGGALHARDPATGEWRAIPGRLVSVSVDRDGRAFGANSLSWVLSSTGVAPGATAAASVASAQKPAAVAGEITLGELAGALNRLPEGLAGAVVKISSGDPKLPSSVVIGETRLNGLATTVARVPTPVPALSMLLVGHPSLALGDYLTGLQGTAGAELRLANPVFAFVPKGVPSAAIAPAQATALGARLGRRDLAAFKAAPGISLLATLDLSGSAEGKAMALAMGFDPADLALTAKDLDTAFFSDVSPGEARITDAGARSLGDLGARYGTTFAQGLEFRAPATGVDRKRFGPAMLKDPVWSLVVGRPGAGKLAGVEVPGAKGELAAVLALDTTLALELRVPDPDTVPQNPAAKPPGAPRTSVETLEAKGARIVLDFAARTVKVQAKVTRDGASSLASLKGFRLDDAVLAGSVKLPASPGVPEALDLKLNGKGELPSAARAAQKVDLEVTLVLDEAKTSLVPTATVTGNLTLADLVGNVIPGLSGIRLTRIELSRDTVAGTMMLYGLPVRAVRYKTASMAEPIVGLQHRELNLTSYIPKLRDTPLGSFGLVNTTIFVRSDAAKGTITYADRKSLPKELAALIDPKAIADDVVFPLELRPGVNLVGQYGPRDAEAAAAGILVASAGPLVQLNVPSDVQPPNVPLPDASGLRAPNAADVATARKVLAAFGIKERSYPVKANFRASAVRNASYEETSTGGAPGERGGPSQGGTSPGGASGGAQPGQGQPPQGGGSGGGSRSVSARDVACGVNAGLSGAAKAGIDPVTGLDLSFTIPDFKPPYGGEAVSFGKTRFTLKEMDGLLEPAILTMMELKLPRTVAGIDRIGLATRIRVKGDLDVLCRGVKPESEVEVQFAGSTALNLAGAGNAAFEALKRVTELAEADPKLACDAKAPPKPAMPVKLPPGAARVADAIRAAVDAQEARASIGWKNAFGLPFLEIRKFSASGTFAQKDGKRSLVGTAWTESVLGSQKMDVTGSLTLEAEPGASEFKVADWLWRVPGPVKLAGLPGVDALVRTTTFLELGDLSVCNLDATPALSSGTLASEKKAFTGNLVLTRRARDGGGNEYDLWAAVDRFAPNMVLKKEVKVPGLLGELTLGRTLVAMRGGERTQVKVSELPPLVSKLFVDTAGALADADTTITLVKGLSIAGRISPKEIPARPATADLRDFLDALEVTEPMPIFGGLEVQAQGGPRGFAELLLASLRVPGLPQGELRLSGTRVSLANLDGRALEASTEITFVPPEFLARAQDGTLRMPGTLQYRRAANGDRSLLVAGRSGVKWNASLGLSDLSLENVGIEYESKRAGKERTRSVTVLADANFRRLAANARIGLTSDGSGRTGTLLELVAKRDDERLSLDTLVHALPLLPQGYRFLDLREFVSLDARGFLVAREAGSGRVTLAAEDVQGRVNGQAFRGQIAIAGVSGPQPVLFIANDERWTPARVFPDAIPKGPFGNLQLPDGLVVLSPSKADANLSELHPRIYDKVFAKLFGARDAAKVLVNDGLTLVGKLDLSKDRPPVLAQLAGWLPSKGDLVIGAGIDGSSGGLAFYADVKGFRLNVPSPLDTFVRTAGGQVTLFFKTAGATGEGAEAGLSTDVQMGIPRLDNPTTMQVVDAKLGLSTTTSPGSPPTVAFDARVPGTWRDPAGLEGFLLEDTAVSIGVSGTGTVVKVSTNRAQFRESNGKLTRFALDLDSAWAGGAPTQLAVQFAKSPDTPELVVSPQLQIELQNSVLQLALKGGSSLYASVAKRLEGVPGFDATTRSALTQAAALIGKSARGATMLMRNSPMSMIGIRNPEVFFATPGNDLPVRPGVERPPLGLGLVARGQLILDIGSKSVDLADGVYRINLREGYFVSGTVTPPAPFSSSSLKVAGSQPLFSTVPNALVMQGNLELPGNLVPQVPARISGSFEFRKPVDLEMGADVKGRISIGGLAARDAYFTVRGGSMRIHSSPSSCDDIPVKLDGTVSAAGFADPAQLLRVATVVPPDPVECAKELGKLMADAGKALIATGEAAGRAAEKAAVAVGHAADQAAGAAAGAAVAAFNGARNVANAIGRAFGGGGTKTCNQRYQWLRERGNEPFSDRTQQMIDGIYVPMRAGAEHAGQLAGYAVATQRRWAAGNDALAGIRDEWNRSNPGLGLPDVAAYHAPGAAMPERVRARWPQGLNTASFGYPGRGQSRPGYNAPSLELIAIGARLRSGLADFNALAGWPSFADPWSGWRGRNESQWLWWRCASVWQADIPVRTALAWRLYVPVHKGQYSAMFIGRGDYEAVKGRVAGHVRAKRAESDAYATWMRDFSAAWSARSMHLVGDVLERANRSLGEPVLKRMRALSADPRVRPQFNEYADALVALQAQVLAINVAESSTIPSRAQAAGATARVVRAAAALRAAVDRIPQ